MLSLWSLITNPADVVLAPRAGLGGLYVGSRLGLDPMFLRKHHISVVISMEGLRVNGMHEDKTPKCFDFGLRDHVDDESKLAALLPKIMGTIHRYRTAGHNVLVHCHMGVQRAPTVCSLYLHHYGYAHSVTKAINKVRRARPVAFGNGFTFRSSLKRSN